MVTELLPESGKSVAGLTEKIVLAGGHLTTLENGKECIMGYL